MTARTFTWAVTVTDLDDRLLATYSGASVVTDPNATEDDVSRSVCSDVLKRDPHLARQDLHFRVHLRADDRADSAS